MSTTAGYVHFAPQNASDIGLPIRALLEWAQSSARRLPSPDAESPQLLQLRCRIVQRNAVAHLVSHKASGGTDLSLCLDYVLESPEKKKDAGLNIFNIACGGKK